MVVTSVFVQILSVFNENDGFVLISLRCEFFHHF
jgi:hypothetical protein